jgi:acyl carrier protein
MELNEFVENFAEQFDDTDASEIKAETVFKELDEWSSLVALSVIAMVDEEFDVTIKGDDIRNSITVEDLFNVIKAKTAL